MTAEIIAAGLKPPDRKVLLAVIAKSDAEIAAIRRSPTYVRQGYFARGPEKRVARNLQRLGLLDPSSSFDRLGADLYPSDLGRAVAAVLTKRGRGRPRLDPSEHRVRIRGSISPETARELAAQISLKDLSPIAEEEVEILLAPIFERDPE